jgi:hypothetical protein
MRPSLPGLDFRVGKRREPGLPRFWDCAGESGACEMERRSLHAVDPQPRKAAMQRIKHPPIRNKISLADPTQVRAWTRRLAISADSLKAVIDKVGNSVAAVTKEVELWRASHPTSPAPPVESPPNAGEPAPA